LLHVEGRDVRLIRLFPIFLAPFVFSFVWPPAFISHKERLASCIPFCRRTPPCPPLACFSRAVARRPSRFLECDFFFQLFPAFFSTTAVRGLGFGSIFPSSRIFACRRPNTPKYRPTIHKKMSTFPWVAWLVFPPRL